MTGWREGLERFLATDPRDVGCDEAMAVLHIYAELLAAGVDAAGGACAEDADGLLAAVQDDDLHSHLHSDGRDDI
jgi:hypothetical protein